MHHDDDRRLGGGAGDRAPRARRAPRSRSLQELHARPTALRRGRRARGVTEPRTLAPFGAPRGCAVVAQRARRRLRRARGRRRRTARDPTPGQFYMLAAAERWGGGADERPYLPRAFSVAARASATARARLPARGDRPGHRAAVPSSSAGRRLWLLGPARARLRRAPRRRAPARCSWAAASGSRRSLILRSDALGATPTRRCSASATRAHAGGAALFARRAAGRHRRRLRRPPRLRHRAARAPSSTRDAERDGLRLRAAADARGGAGALRRARRAGRSSRWSPAMACGFGACFGCVVPTRDGYVRLCVDGPVRRRRRPRDGAGRRERALMSVAVEFCGDRAARTRSSTAPGRSTRSPPGARSATRCSSASRSPPSSRRRSRSSRARATRRRGCGRRRRGMINSIGLPNKGLEGFLAARPARARRAARAADRLRDGLRPRRARRRSSTAVGERDEVAALELNVSCPNVEDRADRWAPTRPRRPRCWTRVRPLTDKPLIVKLTPNAHRPGGGGRAPPRRRAPTPSR